MNMKICAINDDRKKNQLRLIFASAEFERVQEKLEFLGFLCFLTIQITIVKLALV